MARTKANDIIVRELSAGILNLVALAPNATEVQDNVARFFNDTPYDLDLVGIRIGSILGLAKTTTDAASDIDAFAVAEVSRQAIAGQQEGIIGNTRSRAAVFQGLNANGGKASYSVENGQLFIGDMKTPLMTLEVQTNLFLHSVITCMTFNSTTVGIGLLEHLLGATLYFRIRGTGYAKVR